MSFLVHYPLIGSLHNSFEFACRIAKNTIVRAMYQLLLIDITVDEENNSPLL
jgi:hypothetical protein